jgi:hypothetical protein
MQPRAGPPPSWTSLLWLDAHLLRNRVRVLARNPRRLLPWLLFLVWLVPSTVSRLTLGGRFRRPRLRGVSIAALASPLAAFLPGAALAIAGLVVVRASLRPPAAFQSPADGRFVVGAGLQPRVVLVWLSLRTARRLVLAAAFYVVVLEVVYLPGLGATTRQAVTVAAGLALYMGLLFGVQLCTFSLQRTLPWLPVRAIGVLLTALGLVSLGAGALPTLTGLHDLDGLSGVLRLLPPGSWLLDAVQGGVLGDLLLASLATALVGAGVVLAGDCLPELWAASRRAFVVRRAVRQGGGVLAYGRVRRALREAEPAGARARPALASASGRRVPPGAWTVAWKEWLAVQRGRGGLALQAAILAGAVVAGLAVGVLARRGSQAGAGTVAAYVAILSLVFSGMGSVRLGSDLRSPLWWLSSAALWSRLASWTLARSARLALPLAAFLETSILASGQNEWALAAVPLPVLLLAWLLQLIGLAAYALLPASSDYRVSQTLRLLVLYAALAPVAVAALAGVLLRSFPVLLIAPTAVMAAELAGLLAFASWRIEGNGLAFAREESQ